MKRKETKVVKVPVSFEVEVPEEHWIDFLTKHPDIFSRGYIGYWAFGAENVTVPSTGVQGWVCFEHGGEGDRPTDTKIDEVVFGFTMGNEPLPEGWFFLDRLIAIKAYVEGVKRYGEDWFENADGVQYDVALQMAVLGEVRYG